MRPDPLGLLFLSVCCFFFFDLSPAHVHSNSPPPLTPPGIFLCLACASRHRGYGVQASFVRSLTLDRWRVPQQTEFLRVGGNARYRAYFAAQDHALPDEHHCACDVCARYRALLAADVRSALRAAGHSPDEDEKEGEGTEEEGEEGVCPMPSPRGGVQCGAPVCGTPADSVAIDAGGAAARVQRRVVGLARTDIDAEEERRLFGESLRDDDDIDPSCDCCRACACVLL